MAYVRNAWYVAAWSHQVAPGQVFPMAILGDRLAIYRKSDGSAVALEDRCVHRLAPLSLGRCEGDRLRCMYHGLLFDSDGTVAEIPGQDLVPKGARVRSYPVVERHSWIWIWMGDVGAADADLIPPAVGIDDPDWILGHGQLDYQAEARLINDNLLDFSHLTYVHEKSFQSGTEHATSHPRITPVERGLRFGRWVRNAKAPPGRAEGLEGPVDNYGVYDFLVPGVLLMWSGTFPAGTAEAYDDGEPDRSEAIAAVTFTSQAVTPMTDKTSRYFFSWGPHRDHGDTRMRDGLMQLAAMAFEEDRLMIEAQQKVIDDTAQPRVMPTAHDRGVTLYNRLVERMARPPVKDTHAA
jgi:vanillate O-demethylase monooxygenase subunit